MSDAAKADKAQTQSRHSSEKGASDIEKVDSRSDASDTFVPNPKLERSAYRKLDWYVLPVVTMFYLLSFLDRTNLGNARVAGMQTYLHMTNKQYSIALTVTYVPYIVAELPSNLLLKAVGPNLMLPTMLTLWGLVTTLQGVVHNYAGILACRFFLGLLEGGVFPGLVLYLSFFYPRNKMNMRVATFFSAASISGAFSGILAYGIVHIKSKRPVWSWIFIIEGVFTVAFGLCSYFILPRSPATCSFLNEEEKSYILAKLREDHSLISDEEEKFSWREVGKAFKLPQVGFLAVIFFLDGVVLYSLAYFTPTIILNLKYSPAKTQLMSVPPFAVAFVVAMIAAYISDKHNCRGYVSMFTSTLCVIGFAIFLTSTKQHVQYGSLFLAIPGTYALAPCLSAWSSNNAAPHTRRATAIAIGFIMTNSGGILSTWLLGYISKAPRFTSGIKTLLGMSVAMVFVAGMNVWYLSSQNKKKAAIRATMSRHEEKKGLGDKSAWFIYNL